MTGLMTGLITGLFGFVSSIVLIVGSKRLGASVLSRPAGSRPGELGDDRDDLDWAAVWEDRRG